MTIATTQSGGVAHYLEQVRRHLADLPDAERTDLLEDLEEHLTELAAEFGDDLEAQIGTPESYAEELRTSVGLTGSQAHFRLVALVGWIIAQRPVRRIRALVQSVRELPEYHRARAFATELRPGWWVLRGYLWAMVAQVFTTSTMHTYPIPKVFEHRWIGVVAVGAGIYASVGLARRQKRDRRWRTVAALGTGIAVVAALNVNMTIGSELNRLWHSDSALDIGYPEGLVSAYGPVSNIFPYTVDGELLDGVLLFDQDGNPVEVEPYGQYGVEVSSDGGDPRWITWTPRTIHGVPVFNLFPAFGWEPGSELPPFDPRHPLGSDLPWPLESDHGE